VRGYWQARVLPAFLHVPEQQSLLTAQDEPGARNWLACTVTIPALPRIGTAVPSGAGVFLQSAPAQRFLRPNPRRDNHASRKER
jgi:hypothetical protein